MITIEKLGITIDTFNTKKRKKSHIFADVGCSSLFPWLGHLRRRSSKSIRKAPLVTMYDVRIEGSGSVLIPTQVEVGVV